MTLRLLKNSRFYQDGQLVKGVDILTNGAEILEIGNQISCHENTFIVDEQDGIIAPGLVDLQVNGGNKVLFNSDIGKEALEEIRLDHQERGTRFLLPTLISTDFAKVFQALEVVREAMLKNNGILGLHLEGPFLNKVKHGGHNPDYIKIPTDYELDRLIEKGSGVIKILTVAPEVFTLKQLEKLVKSGFIISAGHSMATFEEAMQSFSVGVRCITHLYNAMSPLESKSPGLVGAALLSKVPAGIIVDGVHIHFDAVKLAYKMKKDQLFLVSDASFLGMGEGEDYCFEGVNIKIKNGQAYTENGSLAGSSIAVLDAVQNCVKHVGVPVYQAIDMASKIPAQVLGIENDIGQIKKGNSSKLIKLNSELQFMELIN